MSESTKKTKPIRCVVTSDRMDQSRVAKVERLVKHDRYGKYLRRSTKLMFHDPKNETRIGDEVLVEMGRPHSKRKKFDLKSVLRKAGDVN